MYTQCSNNGSQTRGRYFAAPTLIRKFNVSVAREWMWMALGHVVCGRPLCCASWSWTHLLITVGHMAPGGGPSPGLNASRETYHNNYGRARVTSHSRIELLLLIVSEMSIFDFELDEVTVIAIRFGIMRIVFCSSIYWNWLNCLKVDGRHNHHCPCRWFANYRSD